MKNFPLRYFQIVLFLLAAVPCGIPFRYQPNPVFPSELAALVGAALLVLGAVWLRQREGEPVRLPWASLLWFGFAGVLALQIVLVPTPYLCERTVPMLYLLTAALSVWALARAKDELGSEPLMLAFALGLLAGTLFNSGVGFSQVIGFFQYGARIIYGNIGQRNMYGHYLAWGLAALVWLASERKLSWWILFLVAASGIYSAGLYENATPGSFKYYAVWLLVSTAVVVLVAIAWRLRNYRTPQWVFWPLAVWLALSMAWSGSRSVFMYALVWLPAAGLIIWRGRDNVRRFGLFLGAAAVLIMAMQFIAPLINDAIQMLMKSGNEVPTGVDRIASNGSRRLVEWAKAWMVFKSHPLLGVGWGAFAVNSVELHSLPQFARSWESVLFTHSHNSLLNLMAETGLLGAGVVVAGLLWLYAGLLRNAKDPIVLLATAMVTVSILHSLVEYPLWYYHLFGPFALMLVFMRGDGPVIALPARILPAGFALCAGALLATAVVGGMLYLKLYPILEPADNEKANASHIAVLEKMRHNPLLDFYGDYALSNYIVASEQDIPWKLTILRKLNSIRPYPGQMTDQAVMEALTGNAARAHQLMRQAAYAYPESFDYFYQTLGHFKQPEVQALMVDVEEARLFLKAKKPVLPADGAAVPKPEDE